MPQTCSTYLRCTTGCHNYNFLTTLFRAFTGLDRIIFLDSTDLEFFSDVLLLESQFEDSWSNEAVMGVGLDLSPHYKKFLAEYIEINPETEIGKPGPRQGFNTGVVLFRCYIFSHLQ